MSLIFFAPGPVLSMFHVGAAMRLCVRLADGWDKVRRERQFVIDPHRLGRMLVGDRPGFRQCQPGGHLFAQSGRARRPVRRDLSRSTASNSTSLAMPTDRGIGSDNLGRGLNPFENLTGNCARDSARSNRRMVS